jgi:hypothetical protein
VEALETEVVDDPDAIRAAMAATAEKLRLDDGPICMTCGRIPIEPCNVGSLCPRGAPLAEFRDLVEVIERVQIGADGKPDESTRSIEVLGPATSADLLELDAVPDPVDSDAPRAAFSADEPTQRNRRTERP